MAKTVPNRNLELNLLLKNCMDLIKTLLDKIGAKMVANECIKIKSFLIRQFFNLEISSFLNDFIVFYA